MLNDLQKLHIIASGATLLEALRQLNSLPAGAAMTLVAVDSCGRAEGTVTDGDLRRGMLDGLDLSAPVSAAMHRSFECLDPAGDDNVGRLRRLRERGIRLVPELDAEGKVIGLVDLKYTSNRLPVSAILIAGGRGERLRPLTLTTPKPLLKVGDKAIIDYNVDALHACGVDDISVTVNYLGEQIEEHFARRGDGVKTVREESRTGTLGSASLCDIPAGGDTIVMNADLLTTLSLEEFYLHHHATGADITIAAIPYNVSVPYAILDVTDGRVEGLREKPLYSYFANAGIYLFSNRLLRRLERGAYMDATDFIENAIAEGLNVGYFPISGTWIDIGSPADYTHACELMKHLNRFPR